MGLFEVVFICIQWTWGIIQTFMGLCIFIAFAGNRHYMYNGAVVTEWQGSGSVSLGFFIFVSKYTVADGGNIDELNEKLLIHEYGHTIQSLILGPFYMAVIGIPSFLWANLPMCRKKRQQGVSYYSFYTEKSADRLGNKFAGKQKLNK